MSNKTKKARFVINMSTGAWGPRTEMTDRLPLTFRLIDDETCKALVDGRITSQQVIEAIKRDIMSRPDFSWEGFDRQRQAEKLKLNISQHDMVPIGDDGQKDDEPSGPEDVVSLADVLGGEKKAKGSSAPPASAAPVAQAAPAENPSDAAPAAPAHTRPPKMKVNV